MQQIQLAALDKQCRGKQMRPYSTNSVRQVVPPKPEFHRRRHDGRHCRVVRTHALRRRTRGRLPQTVKCSFLSRSAPSPPSACLLHLRGRGIKGRGGCSFLLGWHRLGQRSNPTSQSSDLSPRRSLGSSAPEQLTPGQHDAIERCDPKPHGVA